MTVDPMILAGAVVMAAGGVAAAWVQIINARANAKERELAALERAKAQLVQEALVAEAKEIKTKVDGNYSDLKTEVLAAKAETITANQRIAVLTERLITSTPASATAPVAVTINGTATPAAAAPATEHLEEIEVNTKETADTLKGTARSMKTTAKALKGKK